MSRRRARPRQRAPDRSSQPHGKSREPRAVGILLGGSLYSDDPDTGRSRGRRWRHLATVRAKDTIDFDLRRWKTDIDEVVYPFFASRMKILHSSYPALQPDLDASLSSIRSLFQRHGAAHVIYWYGHGEGSTGDWSFTGGRFVRFEDLMELWIGSKAHRSNSHLIVLSDTCFSGEWLPKLHRFAMSHPEVGAVSLQCGCRGPECSVVDSDQRPWSTLLRKMMSFDNTPLYWCLHDQHPTFLHTPLVIEKGNLFRDVTATDDELVHLIATPRLHFVSVTQPYRIVRIHKHQNLSFSEDTRGRRRARGEEANGLDPVVVIRLVLEGVDGQVEAQQAIFWDDMMTE